MFQRTDFPLILLLRRKYLAIGGVGGGVMLISMSEYTTLYSKILGEDSNTRSCPPRVRHTTLILHLLIISNNGRSGALRAFVAHVCSYGRVPCLQSSVFRAVFAFGFAALRKLGWTHAGHACSSTQPTNLTQLALEANDTIPPTFNATDDPLRY